MKSNPLQDLAWNLATVLLFTFAYLSGRFEFLHFYKRKTQNVVIALKRLQGAHFILDFNYLETMVFSLISYICLTLIFMKLKDEMIHLNMTKCNFWKCGGILNDLQRFSMPRMYDAITEVGHAINFLRLPPHWCFLLDFP